MKTRPGSAVVQALLQISAQISRALTVLRISTLRANSGFAATLARVGNWSAQSASSFTACMKASETATETLACSIVTGLLVSGSIRFAAMNSSMSGWSSSSMIISAPRRVPPCWITRPVITE